MIWAMRLLASLLVRQTGLAGLWVRLYEMLRSLLVMVKNSGHISIEVQRRIERSMRRREGYGGVRRHVCPMTRKISLMLAAHTYSRDRTLIFMD